MEEYSNFPRTDDSFTVSPRQDGRHLEGIERAVPHGEQTHIQIIWVKLQEERKKQRLHFSRPLEWIRDFGSNFPEYRSL